MSKNKIQYVFFFFKLGLRLWSIGSDSGDCGTEAGHLLVSTL